jgi:hypothetical protein
LTLTALLLGAGHTMNTWFHVHRPDLVLFTATANTSIVTLNLSLMLNKVGFYQVRRRPKPPVA